MWYTKQPPSFPNNGQQRKWHFNETEHLYACFKDRCVILFCWFSQYLIYLPQWQWRWRFEGTNVALNETPSAPVIMLCFQRCDWNNIDSIIKTTMNSARWHFVRFDLRDSCSCWLKKLGFKIHSAVKTYLVYRNLRNHQNQIRRHLLKWWQNAISQLKMMAKYPDQGLYMTVHMHYFLN